MNLEALNDPELFDETPIGRLRVVPWCGRPCVAIMDKHDPDRVRRIIHTLRKNENPLNAIYGKRTFEKRDVVRAYFANIERDKEVAARKTEDMRKDTRIDVEKQLQKSWDGSVAELIRRALGEKPDR